MKLKEPTRLAIWGAAASVAYSHRNLFKGSETFTFKLRGAYEAVTGLEGYANSNYLEYGVEASLSFPEFMFPFLSSDFRRRSRATSEVTMKYNWQIRPEFERTVASAAWSYRWGKRGATHRFDVFDLNYIYMPYRSETFVNTWTIWTKEILCCAIAMKICSLCAWGIRILTTARVPPH